MRQARPEDLRAVLELLEQAALPLRGVKQQLEGFVLEFDGGAPGVALAGVAGQPVRALLEQAQRQGLKSLSLLTTTAEGHFPRHGSTSSRPPCAPPRSSEALARRKPWPCT